ncbi:MAG: hypothetical protein H0U86_12905, partial [Chloroflexi bacterium]|nr:hypothetical protein [Chloroflexota bacterium]
MPCGSRSRDLLPVTVVGNIASSVKPSGASRAYHGAWHSVRCPSCRSPSRTIQGVELSDLLLGLDIGTSSSKGVLATVDGQLVAVAERPHALSLPRPGWAEHDAETVWWADALEIFRELLE